MSTRLPNPHSPVEVRQSIGKLRNDTDENASNIATVVTSVSAVSARVTELEGVSPDFYSGEVVENIQAGMPVYGLAGLTSVGLARADTQAKSRVSGIARDTVASGFALEYSADGKLTLSDWTSATGSVALTPNSVYYLSDTGGITTTAPTTAGLYLVEIGRAASTTTLDIEIKRPILL